MSHAPESRAHREIPAHADSRIDAETPLPAGDPGAPDGSADADGVADRPHPQIHDPYQPL